MASEPKVCEFCDMTAGVQTQTTILHKTEHCIIVNDILPKFEHHFQVIPLEHIRSVFELNATHIPLLNEMWDAGKSQVNSLIPPRKHHTVQFGFHIPPKTSVHHLHMHFIAGIQKWGFSRVWYISVEDLITCLEKGLPIEPNENGGDDDDIYYPKKLDYRC
eukprot:TRINITY_DN11222_c0_g1_i1.p1 TRINITY_DN11222_c0_g1~~TRINITY_DN11222_c0_g1_i1.p1  ORF type:complete len:187 (-),score=32.36 TRINITY_DN11222_c0_g1_i1:92-574(-)